MRVFLKSTVIGISLVLMVPFATLAGFGKISIVFKFFAQIVSLLPGIVGDYLRVAYYAMTLERCSLLSRISFGTFFAQRSIVIEKGVYIGAYCVIGSCRIGERTHIASQVQIFGGGKQHERDPEGRILGADETSFKPVIVGSDCWIGASAIVMADIGAGTTIGAGSVVPRQIPAKVVAVGNPARIIKEVYQ